MSTRPRRAGPCFEIGKTACVGLRSTPDCRARRALLHLAYSCIPPCGTGDTRDTRSDRTSPGCSAPFGNSRASADEIANVSQACDVDLQLGEAEVSPRTAADSERRLVN